MMLQLVRDQRVGRLVASVQWPIVAVMRLYYKLRLLNSAGLVPNGPVSTTLKWPKLDIISPRQIPVLVHTVWRNSSTDLANTPNTVAIPTLRQAKPLPCAITSNSGTVHRAQPGLTNKPTIGTDMNTRALAYTAGIVAVLYGVHWLRKANG